MRLRSMNWPIWPPSALSIERWSSFASRISRLKKAMTPMTFGPLRSGMAKAPRRLSSAEKAASGRFGSSAMSGIHSGRWRCQTRPGSPTSRASCAVARRTMR